jgi:plasmid stabilization system protein ParE
VSEYIISQPAIRDLEAISAYFADVNIEAGERFLQRFSKRCQQLASRAERIAFGRIRYFVSCHRRTN